MAVKLQAPPNFYDTLAVSGRELSSTHALIKDNLKSVWPRAYTTISANSSVWTSIPKWTLVTDFKKKKKSKLDSNSIFNCNSFQTHQVGTPTFSLPNLVGHFFLLFTQPSFLDENERKMPTYVRFFYQKGANFHLFVSGLHDRVGAKPKFEFYRPVLTLMDSLKLLMSQGL